MAGRRDVVHFEARNLDLDASCAPPKESLDLNARYDGTLCVGPGQGL
jgi:hypothetical protein